MEINKNYEIKKVEREREKKGYVYIMWWREFCRILVCLFLNLVIDCLLLVFWWVFFVVFVEDDVVWEEDDVFWFGLEKDWLVVEV